MEGSGSSGAEVGVSSYVLFGVRRDHKVATGPRILPLTHDDVYLALRALSVPKRGLSPIFLKILLYMKMAAGRKEILMSLKVWHFHPNYGICAII